MGLRSHRSLSEARRWIDIYSHGPDARFRPGVIRVHWNGVGPQKRRDEMGRIDDPGDSYRRRTEISHLRGLSRKVRFGRGILLALEGRSGRYHHANDLAGRPGHRQQTVTRPSQDRRSRRQGLAGHVDQAGRPGQSLRLGCRPQLFYVQRSLLESTELRCVSSCHESYSFSP